MGKFPKFCSEGFVSTSVDVLCSNVVKFGRRQLGNVVSYLSDKKTFLLALQLSLLRRSRPKSVRASPRERTQSAPVFIQIGSLSAELFKNASSPLKCAVKCFQHSA